MKTNTNTDTNAPHTPGPWTLSDDGQRILGVESAEDWPVIADVYDAACKDQEGAANARIIALAPEMLAALEQIITLQAHDAGDIEIPTQRVWAVCEILDKAKGGAQ